jgi:hypothetical protein
MLGSTVLAVVLTVFFVFPHLSIGWDGGKEGGGRNKNSLKRQVSRITHIQHLDVLLDEDSKRLHVRLVKQGWQLPVFLFLLPTACYVTLVVWMSLLGDSLSTVSEEWGAITNSMV